MKRLSISFMPRWETGGAFLCRDVGHDSLMPRYVIELIGANLPDPNGGDILITKLIRVADEQEALMIAKDDCELCADAIGFRIIDLVKDEVRYTVPKGYGRVTFLKTTPQS